MKSNKGITLVALVITIIVLLILAGVSISLVVGDNGIMTRAKDAGTKTNETDAVENFKLAVASLTSQYYADLYGGTAPTEDSVAKYVAAKVNTELGNLGYALVGSMPTEGTESAPSVKVKKADANDDTAIEISYKVSEKGNITDIKKK